METKQDNGDICSNDTGISQWWDTHEQFEEQTTGKDDEAIGPLPVRYQ